MTPCRHHDWKCSPLRVPGSGFHCSVRAISGHLARRVNVCVKCGSGSMTGGIRRDTECVQPPGTHGSARDVLRWIADHEPYGRYTRVATYREQRLYGRAVRNRGWLPMLAGGASRFWVGGAATWDATTTTHWASATGGAGGASVPTAADDVTFDANSGGGVITLNAVGGSVCNNFTAVGFTGSFTLTGNMLVSASMNFGGRAWSGTGGFTLNAATGSLTVTSGGATISFANLNFGPGAGSTATWTLQDALNATAVLHNGGTLNTNGKACSWTTFTSTAANTRTITWGATALTLTGAGTVYNTLSTSLTMTANTAVVTCTGANANVSIGSQNTNGMSFVYSGSGTAAGFGGGTATLANITRTGTAVKTDAFSLGSTVTLTGTLTLGGASTQGQNRLLVQSSTLGTARTITCVAVVINGDVDFIDIAIAGPPTWTNAGGAWVGDGLGNSGQTFTAAATQTWAGTSGGSWSANAWSGRVPLPQDNVVIASAFVAAQSITVDMPRAGKDIDTSACTGSPQFRWDSLSSLTTFGSVSMAGSMGTTTGTSTFWNLQGRGTHTITSHGLIWGVGGSAIRLAINAVVGTYTIQDALTDTPNGSPSVFQVNSGTLTLNANLSIGTVTTSGGTFNGGSNTVTATATGGFGANVFSFGATVNASNTTFKFPNLAIPMGFNGGGHTFGTLDTTGSGTGAITLTGANTFATSFIIAPGKTVTFPSGVTTTVGRFVAIGSSGNVITLNASTSGTAATLAKTGTTQVSMDWVSVKDITGSPVSTWFAGANSTNVSGNTNVTFSYSTTTRTISATGGNWSATTAWVEGAVPTAASDVRAYPGSGNLTIDAASSCLTFDVLTYAGTLTHNSFDLSVAGQTFRLVSGMTYTTASSLSRILFSFIAAGTVAITTGGKTLGNTTTSSGSSGSSATYQLQDACTLRSDAQLLHNAGILDTNSQTCSWGNFASSNSNTRTITFGSSAITITANNGAGWAATGIGTITANTATVTFTGANVTTQFGTSNWNGLSVIFNGSGTPVGPGNTATFGNFTRTGTPVKTDAMSINSAFTVTGTLTLGGNTTQGVNRVNVFGSSLGLQRVITCAAVVIGGDVDFMDIGIAGAPTWTNAGSAWVGDAGGNSGQTFTAAAPQTWSGNSTGNWSDPTKWTSRVPLPQDNAVLAALTTGTVTIDMPRAGANLSLTGSTGGSLVFGLAFALFGNYTLAAGVSVASASQVTLGGRSAQTITSAGHTLAHGLVIAGASGTYTLQDDYHSTAGLTHSGGTITATTQNVTVTSYVQNAQNNATRTLNMGSGTWTITGSGNVWFVQFQTTINPGTSTIAFTDTSATVKNFSITASATGARVYNNFSITGGGTGAVVLDTSAVGLTFNTLTVGAPKTVTFPASTTTTVTQLIAHGSSGNVITLNSSSPGTRWTVSQASGIVTGTWLALTDSAATGGATFYAGPNSTLSNSTGWTQVSRALAVKGTDYGLLILSGTNKLRLISANANASADSTTGVPTGVWHRAAASVHGTTVTYYIDGSPAGTATITAPTSSSSPLALGPFLGGGLDEVAVYNYALSAARHLLHYEAGVDLPAQVTTGPAIEITNTGGVLTATVLPGVTGATVWFQWGLSTSYSSTTAVQSLAPGGTPVTITQGIDGLEPGTTYHFRVVASDDLAVTFGEDVQFTVLGIPWNPPVVDVPFEPLDDLPPFEQQSYDVQAVMRAVGGEYGRIEGAREELIDNLFPATADGLLDFFENLVGVAPNPAGLSLAQRQAVVLAYFRAIKGTGSGLSWEQTITSLIGSNWSYKEHNPADPFSPAAYVVEILIPFAPPAAVPVGLGATPSTSSGTLPAATYYYAVSATTGFGETLACTPVTAVLSGAGKNTLTWTASPSPATGYNVYRGASPSALYRLASVASPGYTDNGSAVLSGQPKPSQDTSGNLLSGLAQTLIRQITPAHLQVEYEFSQGFIVGVSEVGVNPL